MSLKTQMVAKMMTWRPWPPLISKKLEVRQVVRRLENLCGGDDSLSCGATVKKDISNYDRMSTMGEGTHVVSSACQSRAPDAPVPRKAILGWSTCMAIPNCPLLGYGWSVLSQSL
nr:uncharacterized protein LOC109182027 isoform X2 [Ipomoea batatas]